MADVVGSYDTVASEYASRLRHELDGKPFDRDLLSRFVGGVSGPVCDLGCGPGHVTSFIAGQGGDVFGLDLSPAMVVLARAEHPSLSFEVGDMTALDVLDGAWGAVIAMYSVVNLPPGALPGVFAELARAVRPGGRLLVSFHVGDEVLHLDDWWDHVVDIDFFFHGVEAVTSALAGAGWRVDEVLERGPYAPEVESQTQRAYVVATRG